MGMFSNVFNPDPRKHKLSLSGAIFKATDITGSKAKKEEKAKKMAAAGLAEASRATAKSKGYTRRTSSAGSLLGSGSGYTPGGSTNLGG